MITSNLFRLLADVFHTAIRIYILIIIVRAVISWMGNIPPNSFVQILRRLTDPVFRLVHRILPSNITVIGSIDISPIIIILALYLIDNLVTRLLLEFSYQLKLGG
ncbi:MAG: YggT family protein [Candidatus Aminicenantes bacterium]|nr:MAG: YggT family protein [Candidatus Aminicenantes bacterium]